LDYDSARICQIMNDGHCVSEFVILLVLMFVLFLVNINNDELKEL
jgi:hypothetical protein